MACQWFPHAIKPNEVTEGPSQLLAFHCATWPSSCGGPGAPVAHRLRVGVAVAVRLRPGEDTAGVVHVFRTPHQWRAIVGRYLSPHRPLWVFAHGLLWHWRLVDGFRVIELNDPRGWRVVMGDGCTLFRGRPCGRSLRAADVTNYYHSTVEELQATFLPDAAPLPALHQREEYHVEHCAGVCRTVLEAVGALLKQRRAHDLGTWGATTAQLAWRTWRHKFMAAAVYPHRHLAALGLERGSLYGGRLSCYRLGRLPGRVWHLDANSLYPSVMSAYPYPRRLERYVVAPSVTWLRECLRSWCACAHVWIDTDKDLYPKRRQKTLRGEGCGGKVEEAWPAQSKPGRVYYPVGVFRTYLCGLELEQAIDRGHVLRVESAAVYEPADLFSKYVRHFWEQRRAARGDGVREAVAKLHLNSLWGKFVQRAPDRVCTGGEIPPDGSPWHHWYRDAPDEGEVYECQAVGGVVTEEVKGDGSWDSFPAVGAHVCANGRAVMARVKESCGAGHYWYEDTDSLLCDDEGFDRLLLAGWVRPRELGYLKLKGEHEHGEVIGPKHYRLDGRLTLAGRDGRAFALGPAAFGAWRDDGVGACISAHGARVPHQTLSVARLAGKFCEGVVGEQGAVTPFRLDCHFGPEYAHGPLAERSGTGGSAFGAEQP